MHFPSANENARDLDCPTLEAHSPCEAFLETKKIVSQPERQQFVSEGRSPGITEMTV